MFIRTVRRSNDRAALELRAYARQEWGTDDLWIHSQVRTQRPVRTLRERLRRMFGAREVSRRVAGPAVSAAPDVEPLLWDTGRDCPHDAYEALGSGGSAELLRCILCGAVLIAHGDWRRALEPVHEPRRVGLAER